MIYIACVGGYGAFAAFSSFFFKYKVQSHAHLKSKASDTKKYQINYDEGEDRDSIKDPNRYLIATSE